jgi:hypothetical protein
VQLPEDQKREARKGAEPLSLHGMTPEQAIKKALSTPPPKPASEVAELLMQMEGCRIPSVTGKAVYQVSSVKRGEGVTLMGRPKPSFLAWTDIEKVYAAAKAAGDLTPKMVDGIVDHSPYLESSTMCALVLAMIRPERCQQ